MHGWEMKVLDNEYLSQFHFGHAIFIVYVSLSTIHQKYK